MPIKELCPIALQILRVKWMSPKSFSTKLACVNLIDSPSFVIYETLFRKASYMPSSYRSEYFMKKIIYGHCHSQPSVANWKSEAFFFNLYFSLEENHRSTKWSVTNFRRWEQSKNPQSSQMILNSFPFFKIFVTLNYYWQDTKNPGTRRGINM